MRRARGAVAVLAGPLVAPAQAFDDIFDGAPQGLEDVDTFGKFPGTVPTVFLLNYVQAHHLDLDFYDRFFRPGAYLGSHAEHLARWHPDRSPAGR